MSSSNNNQDDLLRQVRLFKYANTKRNHGDFNDVTIQAGTESIPANRMVLACYSKFFESMFLLQFKERYQNIVEIKDMDGQAIKYVIEYIYSGKINVNASNVMKLLEIAHFLQVDDVGKMCFEFLLNELAIDNCLDVMKVFGFYSNPLALRQTYQFISKNFEEIVQEENFTDLCKLDLTSLITNIDRNTVSETSLYTAIIKWVKHDATREIEFSSLFVYFNLEKMPPEFVLSTIANERLVKDNNSCLNVVLSYFTSRSKQTEQDKVSKLLCLGGNGKDSVIEVYNVLKKPFISYPNLPYNKSRHRALKLGDFIYCIGGNVNEAQNNATRKVYRLNLKTANLRWQEIASMKEQRLDFGAATWNGNLVVTGGYNGISSCRLKLSELYEPRLNKWRTIASMIEGRRGHEVVVADGKLFAIGGSKAAYQYSSSVEQLDNVDGRWTLIKPMYVERCYFAAVTCNNFIYAIGGLDSRETHKTVEKYDLNKNTWSFVKSMSVERRVHEGCVLNEKILLIGGRNNKKAFKSIECYDPALDEWSVIDETEKEFWNHSVVAV